MLRLQPPQAPLVIICEGRGGVPLTKRGERFLSSLATAGGGAADTRLIKKFVESSPKSVALNVLSHLLSPRNSHPHLSSLAIPFYAKISEESWFTWNSKLVADIIALLNKQGRSCESEVLTAHAISKLKFRERDLAQFYCNLIESHVKNDSVEGFDDSCAHLFQLVSSSSSLYVKQMAYKSMVGSLCEMGRPHEAEEMIEEMKGQGLKPGLFEYRSIVYGYGRLGLFENMERSVSKMEGEGFAIDTVCSNMVLSSYGMHNAILEMFRWLEKIKSLAIPLSIRTYNSILNSCPTFMSLLQDLDTFPLSIMELCEVLNEDEALLVGSLAESSVLNNAMEWGSLEVKLDLHGMHLCSAYLIMLQWIERILCDFQQEKCEIPLQVTIVCGSGTHSNVRGESPVKILIKKMMVRMKSPMKIDRKNNGCFVAKGKVVRNWLNQLRQENTSSDIGGKQFGVERYNRSKIFP